MAEQSQPLVLLSVIIPIYNSAATLQRTLQSITQTAGNQANAIEIICSDDGSTDASTKIAQRFARAHDDFLWKLIEHENTGVSGARNRALDLATGHWVLFLDADDELVLDPLEQLAVASESTTAFCFAVERFYQSSGKAKKISPPRLQPNKLLDRFTSENPLAICSVIVRRDQIRRRFDLNLMYLEDWKFWLENLHLFRDVQNVHDTAALTRIHLHGDNRTGLYAETGISRSQIANELLDDSSRNWTALQTANLKMQNLIGQILQNQPVSLGQIIALRCSISLKLKSLVYWSLGKRIGLVHPYQSATEK